MHNTAHRDPPTLIGPVTVFTQRALPRLGMTHNLGGFPHQNVASISVIGRLGA